MSGHTAPGFWMVLVPGAAAYLRYQGNLNPSAVEIYDLLHDLGFLDGVPRERASIISTIRIRLGPRYRGLVE